MAFCANCGGQVADNVAFCPSCGKATGQAAPAGTTTPPPPPSPQAGPAASYQAAVPPPPNAGYQAAAPAAPMADNFAGMLAYFTPIPAIVFLLIEPYNRSRFVRFHSFQCLFATAALVVIDVGLMIISSILHLIPVIGWLITAIMWPLYALAVLALWLILIIKAYQNVMYKLPIIGDLAEKQAGA
jgi:uncharacterized membrane protein